MTAVLAPRYAPYIYVPVSTGIADRWDIGYRTARDRIATEPLGITCFGDSITAGATPMTDVKTTCWPAKLETDLLAKYPSWGRRADYWHNTGPSYNMPGCPFGAPLNGYTVGSLHHGWLGTDQLRAPSVPIANWGTIFTTPRACTDLDVYWTDDYAGTWRFNVDLATTGDAFTYSVDGGDAAAGTTGTSVTVTNTGPGNATTGSGGAGSTTAIKKITISGLPSRVHTLHYGWGSGLLYQAAVQGVTIYPTGRSGGGLKLARIATSGEKATYWADGTNFWPTDPPKYVGMGISPQSSSGTAPGFGFPLQPHLAIIAIGCNDLIDKTDTQFVKGLESMILALRRGRADVSIILVVQPVPSLTYSDVNVGSPFVLWASWGQFVQRMYALARQYNCALVDLQQKWGVTPGAAGYMTNSIHWNDAGHADLATILTGLL